MKHTILIISAVIFFASCSINKNKTVYSVRIQKDILIGECNRKAFTDSPFKEWFNPKYKAYVPKNKVINSLKASENIQKTDIFIVMGTWCSDSRRELPRFYKIIDEIGFPESKIMIIAVDLNKKSGNDKLKGINFTRVPTFIFYQENKEIGRIVESTNKSLEEDILNIIQ